MLLILQIIGWRVASHVRYFLAGLPQAQFLHKHCAVIFPLQAQLPCLHLQFKDWQLL
jgi:hypothetical protein